MFKARTGRTALTILGMGIGISAILFLVGLGYGLQALLLNAITTSDSLSSLDVAPNQKEGALLTANKIQEFQNMQGVSEIAPVQDLRSQLKYNGVVTDATATITKPIFLKLDGKKISEGATLSDDQVQGIVISTAFSKIFNEDPGKMVGGEVNVSLDIPAAGTEGAQNNSDAAATEKMDVQQPFKIIGFIQSEELSYYVNDKSLAGQLPDIPFSRLKIKAASSSDLDRLKQAISDQKFVVSSLSETVQEVNRMFRILNIILAIFGLIALSVSAIGMFNTMTVALLERTKEIGIMKAIGASSLDILLIFIFESTVMGFLGGISGIILGITSGSLFNLIINFIAKRMGGNSVVLFAFPLWFLLLIIGFSIFIGFVTGLVPARQASSIDPLDALRTR